jgi:hypothetical protein
MDTPKVLQLLKAFRSTSTTSIKLPYNQAASQLGLVGVSTMAKSQDISGAKAMSQPQDLAIALV